MTIFWRCDCHSTFQSHPTRTTAPGHQWTILPNLVLKSPWPLKRMCLQVVSIDSVNSHWRIDKYCIWFYLYVYDWFLFDRKNGFPICKHIIWLFSLLNHFKFPYFHERSAVLNRQGRSDRRRCWKDSPDTLLQQNGLSSHLSRSGDEIWCRLRIKCASNCNHRLVPNLTIPFVCITWWKTRLCVACLEYKLYVVHMNALLFFKDFPKRSTLVWMQMTKGTLGISL